MAIRIHLCGAVSVEGDGAAPVRRMPGRQGDLLLAFLVLNRHRPTDRDRLMEVLWPQGRPPAAGVGLRALLSKLRAALGPGTIVGRERLQLVLGPDAWVDVEVAREALHRAENAVASRDWGEVWGAARVAAGVTDRGFLPSIEGPWIDQVRRELEHVHERAERCIAECGLALGGREIAAAERASAELARRRPLDESAIALRMRVLVAAGDTAGALGAFDDLRVRLREEIGTSPGPAIRDLHRDLLGGA